MNMKRPPGLRRVGQGAYAKAGDKIEWTGGLYAIQEQLKLPSTSVEKPRCKCKVCPFLADGEGHNGVAVRASGCKTAGVVQAISLGRQGSLHYDESICRRSGSRTDQERHGAVSIKVSAPERAMMEVLYGVPQVDSYEEARLLMEGLTTLRPRIVQSLLEKCASVKVKRLFMLLAENCKHAWVRKVDLSKVDFGKGKRALVKGGRFDSKYKITVPNTETAGAAPGSRALKDSPYFKQAELMLKTIPHVAAETCFALKGGTAINCSCVRCRDCRWISI